MTTRSAGDLAREVSALRARLALVEAEQADQIRAAEDARQAAHEEAEQLARDREEVQRLVDLGHHAAACRLAAIAGLPAPSPMTDRRRLVDTRGRPRSEALEDLRREGLGAEADRLELEWGLREPRDDEPWHPSERYLPPEDLRALHVRQRAAEQQRRRESTSLSRALPPRRLPSPVLPCRPAVRTGPPARDSSSSPLRIRWPSLCDAMFVSATAL